MTFGRLNSGGSRTNSKSGALTQAMAHLNRHTTSPPWHRRLAQLALTFGLMLFLVAPTQASRVGYGLSPYPIWSELTYFERDTLSDLHLAQKNDPDALLALYLLASGVRGNADYETVRRRIGQFLTRAEKRIVEDDNKNLVGRLLNNEMHNFFFLQESHGGAPNGYAMDQSRLMGIFETGEFNCISASLLYIVLSRHFDLSVQGVLLPSHAFVELRAEGRAIDVETTSALGYDQLHDAAFYERNNNEWFSSRGLQPATFEDYQQRERVSPTMLGARNMVNQHTSKNQMDADDSARLAEISAYIDPDNVIAQEKRLYFYNREIHALVTDQEWDALARLFKVTYGSVLRDGTRFPSNANMQLSLQMYLSGAMLTYAEHGDIDQTLEVMGQLLARELPIDESGGKSGDSRQQIEARITNAVSVLMTKLVERHRFNDGLLVLSLTEGHLKDPKAWPDMTNWFYLRWAEYFWQKSAWKDVVEVLSEYTAQPYFNKEENNQPQELISSAYYNWVLNLSQNNEMQAAQDVVEQCNANPSHRGSCNKAQKVLQHALKKASAH